MQDERGEVPVAGERFRLRCEPDRGYLLALPAGTATHYLLWLCRIPLGRVRLVAAFVHALGMVVHHECTRRRCAELDRPIRAQHAGACACRQPRSEHRGVLVEVPQMKCVAMEGDGQEALAQCDELLNSGYEIKPSLMSMIYQSLGEAYERIGDMAQAPRRFTCKPRQAQAWTLRCTSCCSTRSASPRCSTASASSPKPARVARSFCKTCPSDFALYGAICALLARVLLERNEKERASVLVERSLKRTSHYRHIDMYLEAKMAQAGLLRCEGKPFPRRTRSSSRASCMASRRTFREPCCCVPTSTRRR